MLSKKREEAINLLEKALDLYEQRPLQEQFAGIRLSVADVLKILQLLRTHRSTKQKASK